MQFVLEEFAIIMFLLFIMIFIFGVIFLIHIQNRILMHEYKKAERETGVIIQEKYLLGAFSVKLQIEEILRVKTNKLFNE